MEAKIVGISGSVRAGGATEYSTKACLEAAGSVPGIQTTFISLRGKKISPCIHCDNCIRKHQLCSIQDDFQEIQEEILSADGLIISSPIYCMGSAPFILNVMSRLRPTYLLYPGHFAYRIGGAIAVGGTRNGGQDTTLQNLLGYMQTFEIVITGGPGGNYNGASVWSQDNRAAGAEADEVGMKTVTGLGKRVAELALILKTGKETLEKQGVDFQRPDVWFVRDGQQ